MALQVYRDGGEHTSIVWIHYYMGSIDKVGMAAGEGVTMMSPCRLLMKLTELVIEYSMTRK